MAKKVKVQNMTLGTAYNIAPNVVAVFSVIDGVRGFICNPSYVGYRGKSVGVKIPFANKSVEHPLKFVQFPETDQFEEYDGKAF